MAIITVLKMGESKLQLKADPVMQFGTKLLRTQVNDMIDTMRHFQGVGLAAPQIGVSKQIIVLEVNNNQRYPEAKTIELDVLINPEIIEFSGQISVGWEGCLSVPGLRGKVARDHKITYQAYDEKGNRQIKTVEGFYARIIQHEIDHLNGVLYPERISDFNNFGFEDSLTEFQ